MVKLPKFYIKEKIRMSDKVYLAKLRKFIDSLKISKKFMSTKICDFSDNYREDWKVYLQLSKLIDLIEIEKAYLTKQDISDEGLYFDSDLLKNLMILIRDAKSLALSFNLLDWAIKKKKDDDGNDISESEVKRYNQLRSESLDAVDKSYTELKSHLANLKPSTPLLIEVEEAKKALKKSKEIEQASRKLYDITQEKLKCETIALERDKETHQLRLQIEDVMQKRFELGKISFTRVELKDMLGQLIKDESIERINNEIEAQEEFNQIFIPHTRMLKILLEQQESREKLHYDLEKQSSKRQEVICHGRELQKKLNKFLIESTEEKHGVFTFRDKTLERIEQEIKTINSALLSLGNPSNLELKTNLRDNLNHKRLKDSNDDLISTLNEAKDCIEQLSAFKAALEPIVEEVIMESPQPFGSKLDL